jgi:hypothetical protein
MWDFSVDSYLMFFLNGIGPVFEDIRLSLGIAIAKQAVMARFILYKKTNILYAKFCFFINE